MKRKFLLTLLMGMLIAVIALCFGACDQDISDIIGGDGGTKETINLEPVKSAAYDGKTLSWDAVPNAVKYTVTINGGQEYSVSLPRYGYQANGTTFNVVICAKGNGDNIIDAEPFSMTFNYLGEVSWEDTDEDGTLHWSVLAEATGYRVLIDGQESTVVGNELGDLPAGKHTVQVKPVLDSDPGYYANWTESKTITILDQVNSSSITYKDEKISWPAVKSAASYEVTVNDDVLTSNTSSLAYPSPETDFSVTVRAIGNHKDSFDGAVSGEKAFVYLETIKKIYVQDGIMTWEPVEHAVSYKVKVDGREVPVNEAKYSGLTAGKQINITILPVSEEEAFFSAWSEVFTVQILDKPTLKWFGDAATGDIPANNISWNEVTGASGYTVHVTTPDGSSYDTPCAEHVTFFGGEGYNDEGTYTVTVKSNAPANSGNIYDSLYSNPITIIRLAAPVQADNDFITSNETNLREGLRINFKAVPQAAGYSLSRDGTEQTQNSQTPSFHVRDLISTSETDETTINFSISSVGKEAANNTYILSSLPSKSLNVSVTILAMPQNTTIDGYVFSYGAINRAVGYGINIDGMISVENGTNRDLNSALKGGTHSVSVCARGNGTNILPSNFTAEITVHRLFPPENITIETEAESEGKLTFEPVDGAQGYDVYFSGEQNSVAYDELENINNRISLQGTAITVIANANYFSDPDTCKDYYMTSVTSSTYMFIRLDKPTFGSSPFSNTSYETTQLNWNKPSNIEDSVQLHYDIYDSDNYLQTRANGRSLDITDEVKYAGGQQFSFKIKAIGFSSDNHTQYVNSDYSDIISFWKLAKPEVTRRDGKYVWDAIPRAQRYAVYVDGVRKDYTNEADGSYSYTPDFTSLKRYQVEIYAIGDNVLDSNTAIINSAPKKYDQQTSILATPEFTFAYSNETVTKDGTVTLTLKKAVEHARGYLYYVDTLAQVNLDSTSYTSMPLTTAGSYRLGVQACGGNFDEENLEDEDSVKFYIDSEWAGRYNDSFRLVLLGPPTDSTIKLENGGFLTWAAVQNATGYEIEVTVGGDTRTFKTAGNTASYQIDKEFYNAHKGENIVIRIRALGNSTKTIITSSYTESKEWTNVK